MPSAAKDDPMAVQPVAQHPSKSPEKVLAEAEAQWLFTEEELAHTPSIKDGMEPEVERERRTKGLNFIMQVGIILKLPQLTLSTAGVFFNRFLMRNSLVSKKDRPRALHHYEVAATALFLATKTEENVRRMKEIIIACCRVAQKNPNLSVDESSKDYWRWRDSILQHEDLLLESLCFDLTIDSPHKILFDTLKVLGAEHNKKLRNAAWAFVNDSSLTMLCLLYPARTIAAAAIHCGARFSETRFEDSKNDQPWWRWAAGDVPIRDIKHACNYMANIFQNQKQGVGGPASASGAGGVGGEGSIYVGLYSPEDSEQDVDEYRGAQRTRLRRESPQAPLTPAYDLQGFTSPTSSQINDRGVKRDRDGTPKPSAGLAISESKNVVVNGQPEGSNGNDEPRLNDDKISEDNAEETNRDQKKVKTGNPDSHNQKPRSTTAPTKTADSDQEGSEEGELEE